MELQEQLTALQAENKSYKDFLEGVNAEKIALDQMLVENLKNSLASKKEVILKDEQIRKLNVELEVSKKEKESLQKQLSDLHEEKQRMALGD
jgi:predicted RNase H-like nuclease (RuvC/YqgF family)